MPILILLISGLVQIDRIERSRRGICSRLGTIHASLALLLLLWASCLPALAREYDTHPPVDPHHVDGSSLGGAIDLSSTWLVKPGDDPSYADPSLDDRQWPVFKSGSPLSSYGFRNIDFVWYRTHVLIPKGKHNLALSLAWFSGSYQIYVNGVEVGSSGPMPTGGINATSSNRCYAIPDALLASGGLTIAIRGRIGRVSLHGTSNGGFLQITTLLLGPASLLAEDTSLWFFRDMTSNVANITFEALVLLIALALALVLRAEQEYLALVIYLAADLALAVYSLRLNAGNVAPSDWLILVRVVLGPIRSIAGVEFVRLVLGLRRSRWFVGYEWLLAVFSLTVVFWMRHVVNISNSWPTASTVVWFNLASVLVFIPADTGLPLLALWAWWKRRNPAALLIFFPLIISVSVDYLGLGRYLLYYAHLVKQSSFSEPPIKALHVGWDEISTFIFSGALLLFLVLRTLRIARDRARIASELEAAQTVQQVLMSRASAPTPGFTVESVYHPASEVGGDFFLVSSDPDGSLVAIVGDVSGKGLIAAMRVAMILGVLRREDSRQPALILNRLNEALLTQGEMGFTTACCVRLQTSGAYTLANAGHISPYVAGVEIETPPGLPLGLDPDSQYAVVSGLLSGGQKLVLMSDGVVEARSAKGELYGFDRLPGLTRMPASDIAGIAQRFGQEDDITVLTIACAP